jgi:GTP cyclohydrolase I
MSDTLIKTDIIDVQKHAAEREIAIDKVGIKSLKHPIKIPMRDGTAQHTIANFDMFVNLAPQHKGTHMSRFVDLLQRQEKSLDLQTFSWMLQEMTAKLEADSGYITASFPFFMKKKAPVSQVESLLDYEVTLKGEWHPDGAKVALKVVVPVTSLCPCSKAISEYGAHNQRSHITIEAELAASLPIEDLIEVAEKNASCELYGMLKREDEKYVTERAYDNPKFVEDAVRDVAAQLKQDKRIKRLLVESENFESIHNHSAYARIEIA